MKLLFFILLVLTAGVPRMSTSTDEVRAMCEPTGFRHRFERINLALVINGTMSEEELLQLFIEAAKTDNAFHDHWADEWNEIERVALEVQPAWQDTELQNALHEAAANNRAVRHSEPFRNTYKPHYRLVKL